MQEFHEISPQRGFHQEEDVLIVRQPLPGGGGAGGGKGGGRGGGKGGGVSRDICGLRGQNPVPNGAETLSIVSLGNNLT